MDCKALDILKEAARIGVTPEYITDNGKTGDQRLVVWRVSNVEAIETNGNSVWQDDDSFTDLRNDCDRE